MIQTAPNWATDPQIRYIRDLAARRPTWTDVLSGKIYKTIINVLNNVNNPDPKFVSRVEASAAITALSKIYPVDTSSTTLKQVASKFIELQTLLRTIHVGHYALPRKADGVIDFFEIIERDSKNSVTPTRWVNRLLGSPGSWNRDKLSVDLQVAAARAIASDWVAAAKAYATHFQTCARCDASLSNPRSRKAKIGHDCAKIWGWNW